MYCVLFKKKKITNVTIFAVMALLVGFFPIFNIHAQPVIITSNDDIYVTASVPGCGDNYIQTGRGEQCEGPHLVTKKLNGQTCSSLGFATGTLGCRDTCIFDTSDCSGVASGGSSAASGGASASKVRTPINTGTEITPNISTTNLIFTGKAGPGDVIIIRNGNSYFASGIAASDGTFNIVVSDFDADNYNFNFYAISQIFGKSLPMSFKALVNEDSTTQISNINLHFPVRIAEQKSEEKKPEEPGVVERKYKPLFDVLVVNIVEPEKPFIPFVIIFSLGTILAILLKLMLYLIKVFKGSYINYYEK